MDEIWDVIVVGAGPGGATCAWKCAESGLKTLLLDRSASLPRYKPCGGGIPSSLTRFVEGLEPEKFADLSVTHLRHSWKGKDPVLAEMTTTSGAPAEVWMVMRPTFDHYLVQKAQSAGASVELGARVADLAIDRDGVTLTSDTRGGDAKRWRARFVVGADGAKGIVGARAGLRLGRRYGIAREVELPFSDGLWHPKLAPAACYLDYGTVKNGYAWIFPKRGFLSVGAGMLLPKQPSADAERNVGHILRSAIDILLGSVGLSYIEGGDAPRLWGHPIPFWTGREPLNTVDGRVLLVGDAAGVVQPLFGEGIQYAVRTGDLAAAHIASGTTHSYTGAVADEFAGEFDAALRVGKAFHRSPYLSYRLGVKNPAGTRLVGRLMAGEASLEALEQRLLEKLRHPLRRT